MKIHHIGLTTIIAGSLGLSACGGSNDNDNSSTGISSSDGGMQSSSMPSSSSMMASSSSQATGNSGFEAAIGDFVGYEDWEIVDYGTGLSNSKLGGAHSAGDNLFTRKTFLNDIAANSSGDEYDEGSILIKETFTYTPNGSNLDKTLTGPAGLLAMVKRGGDFNPDHNGWEWFMLEPDLSSVIAQGAEPNGIAGCNGCHSVAETQTGGWDYTFAKPTEFIAETSLFSDYSSWDMIEFDESPANLSGGAHINDANLRRVFQKQIYANPMDAGAWGYPIGTAIVKDITTDNGIEQIVAMVKRGGEFDTDNGNWEYFMLDPADPTQVVVNEGMMMRGALGACIGCHIGATGDSGIDYVFKHEHAPFNTNSSNQFIATKATFSSYTDWTVTNYATGDSNPFLGGAHAASNNEMSRQVFENATSLAQFGSSYDIGSVLLKEIFTTTDNEKDFAGIFAMVKRGGEFNPDHSNWEWLIMDGDQNILERGAGIKGGGCNSCHAAGAGEGGIDYTFSKPTEVPFSNNNASLAMIQNYKSWTVVETTDAPGSAHAGTRITYKKQTSANPYVESGEYPAGTILIKESVVNGSISTIYGMIKRGGNYNPAGGGWQWFTVNQALTSINDNGASAFCGGCHGKASPDDANNLGIDYVFYKEDDPVKMPAQSM